MKTFRLLGAALAALAISACSDGASSAPTVPGIVDIVLGASDDSTGALVVTVSGGRVDSVAGTSGIVYADANSSGASVFVTGTLAAGTVVARIHVPDVTLIASYHVQGLEAANRGTFAQRAPGSWVVRSAAQSP